jgi:hypothetical protein
MTDVNGRTEAEQMAAEHEAANPPARLTDAEREAIDAALQTLRDHDAGHCAMYATLRGLLERTK